MKAMSANGSDWGCGQSERLFTCKVFDFGRLIIKTSCLAYSSIHNSTHGVCVCGGGERKGRKRKRERKR